MARIRSIKPEFWVSEQVAECSTNARLTFVGLWTFSDDQGVHPAKPKTLKAELYPMDDVSAADVAGWVSELIRVGLVVEFSASGERYWHVTGWAKHQKIDRPSCKYPAPTQEGVRLPSEPEFVAPSPTIRAESTDARRHLDEDSSNVRRAPPSGEDRSGEEGREADSPKARRAPQDGDPSRGTRLPKDWTLPSDWRRYCSDRRPEMDPDVVAENFRDYWNSKAGKDGRKADWQATWQGWVRKERPSIATAERRAPALPDDGHVFTGDGFGKAKDPA